MSKIKIILLVVLLLIIILYIGVSFFLSRTIARPNGFSLEKEKDWERENGLYGDFDSYSTLRYEVEGYNGYKLHCELVESAKNSEKYVILSHGYTSNRYGNIKYIDVYRNLGFNCIIYDVRAHGENEKTACSLGNFESEDLYAIIKDTYDRYGQGIELGLHGESMGSSISLSVLGKKPDVKFVVADCGFTNLYDLIKTGYKANNIGFMIYGVNFMSKLFNGYDMKATSAIDKIKENEIPICFIHGGNDSFILPENSEKLAEANKGRDELHIVEGAGHAESRKVLGVEKYQSIIEDFLIKNNLHN